MFSNELEIETKCVEEINLDMNLFLDFIKFDRGEAVLRDNLNYKNRSRYKDGRASYKSKFNALLTRVKKDLLNNGMSQSDIDIKSNRLDKLLDNFICYDVIKDPVMGFEYLYNTIVERIGYVSYAKDYVTWYNISDMLPELLSLLTGTNTEIINYFISLASEKKSINNQVFSSTYLNNYYVPVGFTFDLWKNNCPSVENLIESLVNIGVKTDFAIRGNNSINENYYISNGSLWLLSNNLSYSLTELDKIDIYICYCFRMLEYFILKQVYDVISTKYNAIWTEPNASKRSESEQATGWSLSDIVFQNEKLREFPTFVIKGRCNIKIVLKPETLSKEEVLRDFFNK